MADDNVVNQISRPLQIALLGAVLVAAAYFFLLRPGAEDEDPAIDPAAPAAEAPAADAPSSNAPGVDGLKRATDNAKSAAADTDAASNNAANADPGGADSASDSAAAAPDASSSAAKADGGGVKPSGPAIKNPSKAKADKPASTAAGAGDPADGLLQQLKPGKVIVLAFLGKGADDRAANVAVKSAGKVGWIVARSTSMDNVGKYATITQNLNIMVAPSIVVIGHDKVAQVLTGYVDAKVVRQYASDARKRSGAKQ